MTIQGAHHTSFTVARLEPSLEFFRDALGLEVVYVREVADEYFGRIVGLPGCRVKAALFASRGHCLELFEYLEPCGAPYAPRPCDPGSCHLSLLVEDLRESFRQLQAQGVSFISEPVLITAGRNRGGYGVYLRDPSGILIELYQLPAPTPQAEPGP